MNEELLLGSLVIEVFFMEHLSSISQKDLFMVVCSMLHLWSGFFDLHKGYISFRCN